MVVKAKALAVKCPTCARSVPWLPEQLYRPFCSERCRMIDLGEWVMEEKRIPGEAMSIADDENDGFYQ